MLGHTVIEERPAYGGGTVSNVYFYNVFGQLARSRQAGMATNLYEYDALGELMRSGLDVDRLGTLKLKSPDRIQETTNYYAASGGITSRVTQLRVYPFNDSADYVTNQITSVHLTGLDTNLAALSATLDIYGNGTTNRTLRYRPERVVTNVTRYPDSVTNEVSVTFNGLQRLTRSKTGVETTYSYDALGRQTGVTDSRTGTTLTHYDNRGRIDYVEDPLGNRTSYGYDPDTGRQIAVTNALGKVTRYLYDDLGQLIFTWGDVPYPVKYTYDDYGRMSGMYTYRGGTNWSSTLWPTNSTGDADGTFWQYDLATGLLTNKVYADGNGTLYTYTPEGKLLTREWARQVSGSDLVTTYTYDDLTAELTNINYSALTTNISYGFDRMGRYAQIVDAVGTRTFAYSDKLQLTNETISGLYSRKITRSYEPTGGDVPGRDAGFQMGDQYKVWYAYDGVGRFSALTWTNAGETECHAAYAYLPESDLIETRSSWSVPGLTNVETRTYEAKRDLITEVLNTVHTNTISLYGYVNDALGRRTSVLNEGLAFASVTNAYTRYGYNTRSELTGARRYLGTNVQCTYQPVSTESFSYEYDNAGNRDEEIEAIVRVKGNQLNQSVVEVVPQYQYDADGNLTNDGVFAYGWNGENRLIKSESLASVPDAAKVKVENLYDYMGRRVRKTVSSDYSGGSYTTTNVTTYVWDGFNIIAEMCDAGYTNWYTYGLDLSGTLQGAGGVGGALAMTRDTGTATNTYLYCFDGNGNVVNLVDASDGSIAATYEYSPFGSLIRSTGTMADDNPVRWSTKHTDDETGLVMYEFRPYSPELGRFANRDPIDEEGFLALLDVHRDAFATKALESMGSDNASAQGLYLFVQNDPVNGFDLYGLQTTSTACSRCGPDISIPLKSVIWRIRGDFYSWNRLRRWWACRNLDQIPLAFGAWDIVELSPRGSPPIRERLNTYCVGCPTRDCWHTVEVDGNCFTASRVNYVQFGTMGQLCGWSLTRTLWLVNMWKIRYGHLGADRDTTEWTVAGHNGWPRSPTPTTDPARSHCTTDCDPYRGSFSYIWSGSPRRP